MDEENLSTENGFAGSEEELLSLLLAEEGFSAAGPVNQKILRRSSTGPAPLSFAQQRLWFLDQLEPGNAAYNIPTAIIHLRGTLNAPALEKSLLEIITRHEGLRATFLLVDDRPAQQMVQPDWRMNRVDLNHIAEEKRPREVRQLAVEDARTPFNLSTGPLVRATLLHLTGVEHVLLLTTHHIVSDGWSIGVFYRELAALYEAFSAGKSSPLPELPIQYADYAVWQQAWLRGQTLKNQLAYWQQQLAGAPPVLRLPTDHARPPQSGHHPSRRFLFSLPSELSARLEQLSRENDATLFMTLLSAFYVLLHRYTRQADISVGSPIANRNRSEIEALIGFFVNTLVFRAELSGGLTYRELLSVVRQTALDAYAHQDLPFEKLVEALDPERDLSLSPFFQVMFVLQNAPMPALQMKDLSMSVSEVDSGTAKFDLILEMVENPTGFSGSIEYDTTLFEAETIARMAGHFQTLLAGIAANPDVKIVALPLLTTAERQQLLLDWNRTGKDYPLAECFPQVFEAQVERTPNAIAVSCDDEQLTYRQLNEQANSLARLLVQQGVGPEVVVALLSERGIEFLVMILAVFKAGGAYLPLDPLHPPQRFCQILGQSRVRLVLAAAKFFPPLRSALADFSADEQPRVFRMEALLQQERPVENLPPRCAPANLAYVIFTSGSTGMPKGAMVEHIGMLNHLWTKVEDLAMTAVDIVGQNASQCFDISVWQFLAALLVGGQVRIFKNEIAHNPPQLLAQVAHHKLTVFQLVPSMLRAIIQATSASDTAPPDLSALRWVVPTGEALTTELCRQWLHLYPNIPMLNAYGSTECSDDQCHHPILQLPPPEYDLPTMLIGKAMANVQMYILDSQLEPVPVGVAGQLYVGGTGVGRGYLNDPQRTAEVFIPDPFAGEAGRRLYKTGDLGRYLPDSTIEFLGRVDFMVKIRGFRIELGEIEAALAKHPALREAVVLARAAEDAPDDKYLAAYVVAKQAPAPTVPALRAYLKDNLPDYMIPAAFVILEALPLTSNGKINRGALPAPETSRTDLAESYQAPTTPVESVLAAIWAEVLGIERVGTGDDFFELGGHSLLATQLIFKVRDAFQIEVPLRELFKSPTVAELAGVVEAIRRGGPADISTGFGLKADAVLDSAIRPGDKSLAAVSEATGIFLTGATGFLGAFLLDELLRQTDATIHCLVRADDIAGARQRLEESLRSCLLWNPEFSQRIIPVLGDLARPRLGLSDEVWQSLVQQIGVIYHNGALVNFVFPYERMKAANVNGTREILRLATHAHIIPVHYISTTSVFDSVPYFTTPKRLIREADEPAYSDGLVYGYAQSKWVAEKLVIEARHRGMPVTIYRPGTVVGDSRTGVWNTGDYLGRFIKGCIQLGTMPQLDQTLRMAPVDFVSRAIVHLSRQAEALNQTFHVISPHKMYLGELAGYLQAFGHPVTQIPYDTWQEALIATGTDNALYALLPLFVEWVAPDNQVTLIELLEQEPEFDTRNLLSNLSGSGIDCGPVDARLLKKYLSWFEQSGFLKPD